MVEPTVISTFAGCGGSSLGYKWAGFRELLAIEWEDNAVETFKLNFPEVPVWQRDICSVTGQEILEFCNIKRGELDIFDGSPPCQGFSTAGKRQVKDSRNDLFKEYVRLVNDLQPKVFVMENVSGMVKGKMKGKFIEIMQTLKSLNYEVRAKLMNSMYYEVPQSRQRMIFIGVRKDLNKIPSYPEPLKKVITVREAFKGIENIGERELPRGNLKNIVPLVKPREKANKYHKKGNYFGTHRLDYNKPSPTIIKTAGATMNLLLHPEDNAGISINELKRLTSFPDDFQFVGKYPDQWARIGNAVMPKFMYHIAKHIKENILNGCEK